MSIRIDSEPRLGDMKRGTDFVPRSIALVKPPVCLVRWNPMSRFNRCAKTLRATLRIAPWATLANTALRSSEKRPAPMRASPSVQCNRRDSIKMRDREREKGEGPHAHPTMTVPAIASTPCEEVGSTSTFRVSMMPLKKKGTCTFNSCSETKGDTGCHQLGTRES